MNQPMNSLDKAILDGAERYFDECRGRIPSFVQKNFKIPGCWGTNRSAFGFDLLRAPINLFWAPVYTLLSLMQYLFRRLDWLTLANWMSYLPAGFTTRVQQDLAKRLETDLFRLDCSHSSLESHIAKSTAELYTQNSTAAPAEVSERMEALVEEALREYRVTRTATSDITNTLTSTLIGAFAFYKFTPGGIGIGLLLATYVAKRLAVQDFWLGESLGTAYYYVFPPSPSTQVTLWSLLAVLTVFSIFASFSGLFTDPVQALFKIHHRRLHKMVGHIEQDFLRNHGMKSSFRPKDQYLARMLDLLDMIKSNLHHT